MSYVSGFMIGASIGKSIHQLFDTRYPHVPKAARPVQAGQVRPAPVRPAAPVPVFTRVSASLGRRRYRAASLVRNPALDQLVAESLYKMSGVQRVEVNPVTGSLLILGDEATLNTIEKVLSEEVFAVKLPGEDLLKQLDTLAGQDKKPTPDFRKTATDVCNEFSKVISGGTHNVLDMRSLVALAFIVRGIRKIVMMDQRASGPQMLWWAASLLRGK